jgi:hypothetical protein
VVVVGGKWCNWVGICIDSARLSLRNTRKCRET